MSTLLIAVLATMAPAADAPPTSIGSDHSQVSRASAADTTPRHQFETPQKLRAAVHSAMRRAATTSGQEQVPAIHDLLNLYEELARDARMARDDRIALRGTIRSRLTRVSDQLTRSIARERARRPASVNLKHAGGEGAVLAQQIGPAGARPGAAGQAGVAGAPAAGGAVGPAQIGGQQGPADYGPALVDLIQKTIAPASWDINGGEGSIVYFAPLQVLVVRQTGDVHDHLGGLIRDLQK